MHRPGSIVFSHRPDITIPFQTALFDSGALSANYISPSFLEKHRQHLQPLIEPFTSSVRLGDARTVLDITSAITLTLSFYDSSSNAHLVTAQFQVLETGNDMIIGLPTITGTLLPFFTSIIQDIADSNTITDIQHHFAHLHSIKPSAIPTAPNIGDICNPWTLPPQLAPEEAEDSHPCSFPDALHYLEMSTEEAVAEYLAMFDKQVQPDFAKHTNIIELLKTKGKQVFIPTSWTGIDAPEIELDISPDIPRDFRTARRNVNPKMYDNAKLEFDRLSQYFYTKSTSPWAHPLVIAPKATKPFIRFCGSYDLFANKFILPYHYPIPHVPDMIKKAQGFKYFIDLDLQNAFHQVRIGPKTRRLLAVQTPWGLFEPNFLPEGVGPASRSLSPKCCS